MTIKKNNSNLLFGYKIKFLLRIVAFKYFKSPLNIIFSFLFPIVWTIASFYIWGRGETNGIPNFASFFPATTLLPVISIGGMAVPFTFGFDQLNNRNKIFSTLNVRPSEYFFSHFLVSFLSLFVITNLQLLIGNYGFMQGYLKWDKYLLILMSNLFLMIPVFVISIMLTLFAKSERALSLIILLYFYFILFLSGASIPAISYNPESFQNDGLNWFKWLQYLSPIGCGARINENIAISNLWNWNSDWLLIISPIVQLLIAGFIVKKNFKWIK